MKPFRPIAAVTTNKCRDRSRSARKGGRHQRHGREATASDSSKPATHRFDSEQAFGLVKDWCWGMVSAAGLQKQCGAAYRDQIALLQGVGLTPALASSSLATFAGIGSDGRHANNMRRDLERALGDPHMPEPMYLNVPMHSTKPTAVNPDVPEIIETSFR